MAQNNQPDWDPRSETVLTDQRAAFDEMRERCPVAHSDLLRWSVFRHEDVVRVLHDPETFSNAVSSHLAVPNGMDPPEHTEFRRVIEPYFGPEYMEAFEPTCRAIAKDLLQTVAREAADEGDAGEIEWMAHFAQLFAVQSQCEFLGWPEDMHERLRWWTRVNHEAIQAQDREALGEMARKFEGYVVSLLDERRAAGAEAGDDITTSLMHAKVWDRPLSDEEIVSILRNWTADEVGTIAASVGILTHFLAVRPDVQQQLRDQPSLLPAAIEEILRIDGPLVANRRVTTRPVEIGGREIDAGERLSVIWVSANRDERAFDDAETFRLDRDPAKNLLWGAGIHVCPGAPLARLEMRVFMEELLRATTSIEIDPDKQPLRAIYPTGGFAVLPLRIAWSAG